MIDRFAISRSAKTLLGTAGLFLGFGVIAAMLTVKNDSGAAPYVDVLCACVLLAGLMITGAGLSMCSDRFKLWKANRGWVNLTAFLIMGILSVVAMVVLLPMLFGAMMMLVVELGG